MSTPTLTPETAADGGALRSRDNGAVELVRFLSNPLRYLDGVRDDERDVVPFKLGNLTVHLVKKPELLELAMNNEDWPPISRGRLMGLSKWYTEGLFLTYGPEHHRQRDELWKPLFQEPLITEIAVRRAAQRADSWAEGNPIELYSALRSLCWAIDWEALTGEDLDAHPDLLEALELGVEALAWLILPFGPARWNWPIPHSRRTREGRARLDATIDRVIAERRAQTAGGPGQPDGPQLETRRRAPAGHVQDVVRRRPAPRAVHLDAAPARRAPRGRAPLACRTRRRPRRPRRDPGGHRAAAVHGQGDQGVDARPAARVGLLPADDGRLPPRRGADPGGPPDGDEPVGDAPRSARVAGPAALRPRSLGRRRGAARRRCRTSPSRRGPTSATGAAWR